MERKNKSIPLNQIVCNMRDVKTSGHGLTSSKFIQALPPYQQLMLHGPWMHFPLTESLLPGHCKQKIRKKKMNAIVFTQKNGCNIYLFSPLFLTKKIG